MRERSVLPASRLLSDLWTTLAGTIALSRSLGGIAGARVRISVTLAAVPLDY